MNFEFSNEIFRKIPKFFFPVTSENEIFRRISAKFRRNFKPWCQPEGDEDTDSPHTIVTWMETAPILLWLEWTWTREERRTTITLHVPEMPVAGQIRPVSIGSVMAQLWEPEECHHYNIPPLLCYVSILGKVHFSTLNYHDRPILVLELRNRTSYTLN